MGAKQLAERLLKEGALRTPPVEQSLGAVIRAATWLGQGDDPSPSDGEPIIVENEPEDTTDTPSMAEPAAVERFKAQLLSLA